MLINFANERLTNVIVSDKPCLDSNDVNNLISLDPCKRCKGFIVENFVKPPVIVSLKFICSISISKIIVNSQVGVQKSSCIELYSRRSGYEDKVLVARKNLLDNENIATFVVHNSQNNHSNFVTFRLSKYVCNVDEIDLKILRTQGSTLTAVGKIEIWGKPSKYVSNDIIQQVSNIWQEIISPPKVEKVEEILKLPNNSVFRYCREIKRPTVDIPEEFLDPITCELFVIPMALPSGKIVDASTLERFYKEEEKFGRPASDPFTGLIFTESNHPVVASALKARLDKFLLEYSHIPSIKAVPRTVGRISTTSAQPSCSFKQPEPVSVNKTTVQPKISSVDQLLESCLNGLPSYLEKPAFNNIECILCKSKTLLFKLTCKDLICRNCLVSNKKNKIIKCAKCNKLVEYNKVERFHSADF